MAEAAPPTRTVSLRLTSAKDERGRPEWLQLIHAANDADPDLFDEPTSTGPWWAGGYCEDYPDARVILDEDYPGGPQSARGAAALRAAADKMGVRYREVQP